MQYRLGDFCDDYDKYLDPEAYCEPYLCYECDELFTNGKAFQFHKMLHECYKSSDPLSSSGGRGGADGEGASLGKKNKRKRNARRKAALIDDASDEESAEATTMVLGMIKEAGGQPGRDQFPFYCRKCKAFASRGDYWCHMTKTHKKCVACKQKFESNELIEEHYVTSLTCRYWPMGIGADGGDESDETNESMSGLIYRPVPAVDTQSNSLVCKPASYEKECGVADTATNEPFRCLLCGEIPPSDSALNLHMSHTHNKCLRCKVQFESQPELKEHFSTSKVHKYCQSCSLEFLCQEELETHHKTHHTGLTSTASSKGKMGIEDDASVKAAFYRCQFCTKYLKSFSTAEKLESHLQREHIRCFPCKRVFAAQESLSTHLQMSSGHNYCHLCDTDFVSLESLKRHSFMCNARSQLAAFPDITAPDQTEKRETDGFEAGKSEQALDLSTEMGKLKLNGGTEPQEEAINSDESEWETDDGDEGDTEDLDPPPVVKTSSLKVSRDPPFSGRSRIAGKKAVKSVIKDAANNPRNRTLASTAVKSAPVSVTTTEPRRERDLSGRSIRNYARSFICLVCLENAGTGIALNQHYSTAHAKCQRCNVQFKSRRELYDHFSNSKMHLQKFCETCKTCFSSKEGLRAHNAASHSTNATKDSEGSFPCDACKMSPSFPTEEELEVHLQIEHYRCFPCRREFHEKKPFFDHLTESKQHNYCVQCETDFVSAQALRFHGCLKAKPEEPLFDDWETGYPVYDDYTCEDCCNDFETQKDMQWHEYDSHLWCKKCDKQMTSARAYEEHQLTVHNQCSECGLQFNTRESLADHGQLTHHRFEDASYNVRSDFHVRTKKFVCDFCCIMRHPFRFEEELAQHLRTNHLGQSCPPRMSSSTRQVFRHNYSPPHETTTKIAYPASDGSSQQPTGS